MEKLLLVIYFLGCLICLVNAYTSWCRYPVHKYLLKNPVDDFKFRSGIPLLGSLFIVVAFSVHAENPFLLLLGACLATLDTGGIHWFLGAMIFSSFKDNKTYMTKEEIVEALEISGSYQENENCTALEVPISDGSIDILVTVPYDLAEVYYLAKNSDGVVLVKDWHDHYGVSENEDYIDTLKKISCAIKSASFRVTNNGKTVEIVDSESEYFFGERRV